MDAYVAQYYFNKTEFKSLKLIPQISIDSSTCIGVVKPASTELLSILNKVIQALPQDEMQSIIYANTIFLKARPWRIILRKIPSRRQQQGGYFPDHCRPGMGHFHEGKAEPENNSGAGEAQGNLRAC